MEVALNIIREITIAKLCSKNSESGPKSNLKIYNKGVNYAESSCKQCVVDCVDISFENVDYSASLGFRKGKQRILQNLSGNFPAGQLTAIIGSCGSGKTTLLDILSGFQSSRIQGTIYINEKIRNLHSFKELSCYITHSNYLHPFLTVWESMKIASDLKLGNSISQEKKNNLILEILTTLYLNNPVNTKVQELSGGEQKRLSVALELIENPLVMFLDEPTTGLDSLSCSQCIRLLQTLAQQGKTIVCTIHQPSAALTKLFDQIYLLGEGQCLYQGTPDNLINFLDSVNLQCPKYNNPIDYVIELTSGDDKKQYITKMSEAMLDGKNKQWCKQIKNSTTVKEARGSQRQQTSQYDQFKILLYRGYLRAKRDAKLTYMRLLVNVLSALLYGILYWQTGNDGGQVRNNYSLLFCILIHHMMSTIMLTILTLPNEMPILTKEHFNGWYSLKTYFVATTISDIPILVLSCLLFTAIVYPMTGQPLELHRVIMFTTISLLVVLTVQSSGFIVGSMFNVMNGTFIGFSVSIATMLVAGIGEDLKNSPILFYWINYTSYMKYGFEGILGAIYGWDRPPLLCPENRYCHYKYPKKFLKDICIQGDQFWIDVAGLCSILITLRILAFIILYCKLRYTR